MSWPVASGVGRSKRAPRIRKTGDIRPNPQSRKFYLACDRESAQVEDDKGMRRMIEEGVRPGDELRTRETRGQPVSFNR